MLIVVVTLNHSEMGGMKAVVWGCLAFCNEGVLSPNDLNVPLFQQLCSTATSQLEFNSDQIYSLSSSGNHQNCGSEVICWNQFMKWIPLVKIFSSVCNNDEMLVYCLYGFCAEIFGNNRAATKAQAPTHSFALAFLFLRYTKVFRLFQTFCTNLNVFCFWGDLWEMFEIRITTC